MVDFGARLRELRKQAGLTQQQLADRLWLSKATVSYYEQSLRCPSPEVLVKIAGVFHVTADYLLGIEEKRQSIDVTGLADEDIEFLESAAQLLRNKNYERDSRDKERER